MYSDALLSNTRSGSQIAYVARHFRELQGLRLTPFWTAWFVLSVLSEIGRLSESHYQAMYLGFLVVLCAAWVPWIKRWYRLRYGTVLTSARKSNKLNWLFVMGWLLLSVVTSEFQRFDAYKDSLQLYPMIMFVLPSALHLPADDCATRFRFALYTFVLVSLLVLMGCRPVLNLSAKAMQADACAALVALSLYDHWLLNHLLGRAHESFND